MPDGAVMFPEMPKRTLVWAWLGEIFSRQPSLEAIALYRRGPGAVWLNELREDTILAEGVAGMIKAPTTPVEDGQLIATLGIAFNRMFAGIGGRATVPPYESAYHGNGRLFQQPFSEMKALMVKFGLTTRDGCVEPADHISIELALMSHLLFAASPASLAMLKRLQGWVPAFCADCIVRDTSGFWAGPPTLLPPCWRRGTRLSTIVQCQHKEVRKGQWYTCQKISFVTN